MDVATPVASSLGVELAPSNVGAVSSAVVKLKEVSSEIPAKLLPEASSIAVAPI